MPKMKTHKGMKKRFTVTATGKVKHKSAFRGHKLSAKGGKRRRQLRQDGYVTGPVAQLIAQSIAHGE
jgi:large subunit ribosomal protein L35